MNAVTFSNCAMDGMILSGSRIKGDGRRSVAVDPSATSEGDRLDIPRYAVTIDDDYCESLAWYRGVHDYVPNLLYSPVPTSPATPVGQGRASAGLTDLQPASSGVVIHGGRVSSLFVRGCEFCDGSLSLQRTAGSSIEVVEQFVSAVSQGARALDLDITECAIRSLTISGPVGATSDRVVRMTVARTFLAQTWLGQGLSGEVVVSNSTVFQAVNESGDPFRAARDLPGEVLVMRTDEQCVVHGLVGAVPGLSRRLDDDAIFRGDFGPGFACVP